MANESNIETARQEEKPTFDFEKHRNEASEKYRRLRPIYEEFCETAVRLLNDILQPIRAEVHSVTARAKEIESFGEKAATPSESDPQRPKYPVPLEDVTDLAGLRIITYFLDTVSKIDKLISDQFVILEKGDKSELLRDEEFGYRSVHYLVQLKPNRTCLPEYQRFRNLKIEIQVRTILQHAWAEIEHDIQYKSTEVIPREIRRRFKALAGVLELADREFQSIQHTDIEIREHSEREIQVDGDLEAVEITPYALKAYLNRLLGADGRMSEYSYDYEAQNLQRLGFSNFKQVDDCIRGFDADELNRVLHPTRQGQLSRFEYLLTAGMGANLLHKHRWQEQPWFRNIIHDRIEKFKKAGVPVGNYSLIAQDAGTENCDPLPLH